MECIYYFYKGNSEPVALSFSDLFELLMLEDNSKISDIVYSKDSNLDKILDRLVQLRKDFFTEVSTSNQDNEPNYGSSVYTPQTLINDPEAFHFYDGYVPVRRLSDPDYIKNKAAAYKSELDLSDEEALNKAANDVLNWKTENKDSLLFHKLINSFNWHNASVEDWRRHVAGTKFEFIADELFDLMALRKDEFGRSTNVLSVMFGQYKYGNLSLKIVSGISLKANLSTSEKEIVGHFDNILIDAYGTLHVYNYKYTTSPMSEWGAHKMETYKYEMALLKLILAANGYNVNGITLHLIPVRMYYNEDFSKIDKVQIYTKSYTPGIHLELTVNNGLYVFAKYDAMARYLIHSESKIEGVKDVTVLNINKALGIMFPNRNVNSISVLKTAEEWIKANFTSKFLDRIKRTDKGFKVFFDPEFKEFLEFEGSGNPLECLALVNAVELFIEENQSYDENQIPNIQGAIQRAYKGNHLTITDSRFNVYSSFLSLTLEPYLQTLTDKNGNTYHVWKMLEDPTLEAAGILAFLNIVTNQIDTITLASQDLRAVRVYKGLTNLMSYYIKDIHSGKLIDVKNTGENIHGVRTAVIMNEILPHITGSDTAKLGALKVISLSGNTGQMSQLDYKKFGLTVLPEIVKAVKKVLPDFEFLTNFKPNYFINPLDLLLLEYKVLTKQASNFSSQLELFGFDNLENINSMEEKRAKLIEIAQRLEELIRDKVSGNIDPKTIIQKAENSNKKEEKAICSLYVLTQRSLANLSDYYVENEYKLNWVEENVPTLNAVANRTYRGVVGIFTHYVDNIADETSKAFYTERYGMKSMAEDFRDFYKNSGYTDFEANFVGDSARVYENLFKRNENNEIMMEFKNPYSSDFSDHMDDYQREFLKRVLFRLAKVRSKIHGFEFEFKGVNDPELINFINLNSWYFNVPLKRARDATRRTRMSMKDRMVRKYDRMKNHFSELIQGRESYDDFLTQSGIYDWSLKGLFTAVDGIEETSKARRNQTLNTQPSDFWETDLESLLIDFEEDYIRTRELNKALIETKSVLLQLEMLGEHMGRANTTAAGLEQTINLIHKFVKKNFFEKSLLEPKTLKFMHDWIDPFRKLVSRAYIAGNIISAFRDTFEGLWLNYVRTVNKFHSGLSTASVTEAYKEVMLNMFKDINSINKMDLLCKIYRLSNSDVSRISDLIKSNRGGIFNYENWMYATLRKPDYLNRMTLFVSRCMEDGSWDAFSVNEKTGELKYDWKLDKRFKAYADGPSAEGYNEARKAYFNAMAQYNKDHNTHLVPGVDNLPEAYSQHEIESIRELANNIYGSYDHAMRSAFENQVGGIIFGSFTTWMNGMYNNYARKPGVYTEYSNKIIQETDVNGNAVFLDGQLRRVVLLSDGALIYMDNGEPYQGNMEDLEESMEYVPDVVQGIYFTLKNAVQALRDGKFKEDIWLDPKERENLNKLISDLLIGFLFLGTFKLAIDPAYKDYTKHRKEHGIVEAGIALVLYSSTSRSYDGFLGPINIVTHIGNNSNPPFYSLPIKIVEDLGLFVFGDKTWDQVLTGNVAIIRTFLEAIRTAKAQE